MCAQGEAYKQTVRLPTADYLPASRHTCLSKRAHKMTDSTQRPIQTAQVPKGDQGSMLTQASRAAVKAADNAMFCTLKIYSPYPCVLPLRQGTGSVPSTQGRERSAHSQCAKFRICAALRRALLCYHKPKLRIICGTLSGVM